MQPIIKYQVILIRDPIIWNLDCQVRTLCKRYSNQRSITMMDLPHSTNEYKEGMEKHERYQFLKARFCDL